MNLSDLFVTGSAQNAMKRVSSNKGNIIAQHGDVKIVADNPKYMAMMRSMADELTATHPAEIDELGVAGKNGVTGDFYSLRTVSGYYMKDITLPPRSNEVVRSQLGLADGFTSSRHRMIWDELFDAMFTTWVPDSVAFSKISSTVMPFFMTEPKFKKDAFIYYGNHLDQILNMWRQGKQEDLFRDHKFVIGSYLNKRAQVDTVIKNGDKYTSKPREVSDWEYARTAGAFGKRFVSDKTVYVDGQLVPGHFGMRLRSVYGMSACFNYPMTGIFSGFRNHYLKEYAFTWKHTTREAIYDKVADYENVIGVDVKQYDQSFGSWMFDWWCDRLADKSIDERAAFMLRDALSAPYYSTHPTIGMAGGFWLGNPMDKSTFNLDVGLPSGIAPNPDLGKLGMTAALLCGIDDYTHDVVGNVRTVLKGEHPLYGLLDMGDDCLIMTNSQGLTQYVRDRLSEGKLSPYFIAEKEQSISFLGNVLHRRYDGTRTMTPNIASFVVNWFCPERGVNNKMRHFWPIGWFERQSYYSKSPIFGEVIEVIERHMRNHFGTSMEAIASAARRELRMPKFPALSQVDQLVLEDPSKLYYRIDPSTVNSIILDELICSVPETVATPIISPFIKGVCK